MADDYLNEAIAEMPWPEILKGLGLAAAVFYFVPSVVAFVHDLTLGLPFLPTIIGTVHVIGRGHVHNPAAAYPPRIAQHMPGGTWWWLSFALALTGLWLSGRWAWRRVEPAMARGHLGRHDRQLKGSRPRTWAKARDLRDLARPRDHHKRFSLGKLEHRRIYSDIEDHILVVARTRAGKTRRCVIPWLLEHDGPAIVTSTKTDVLDETEHARRAKGDVYIWNPFGTDSLLWTPLEGCTDWATAFRQAHRLAEACRHEPDSEAARFFRGEAARLLAPLLHAAAHATQPIQTVIRWIDTQDEHAPAEILAKAGADAARDQLTGVLGLDDRNRGSTYMSAGSLLAVYRRPDVQTSDQAPFTATNFFNGGKNTLYMVAAADEQDELAPLAGALLSELIHHAMHHPLPEDQTLRILLDEAAQTAPLNELPSYLAQAAGHNIRIATVWQSLAQLNQLYQSDADTILANSATKLFMGPIDEDTTRNYLISLIGDEPVPKTSHTTDEHGTTKTKTRHTERRPAVTAKDLQQLARGRAVLITGNHLPAIVDLPPHAPAKRPRQAHRADREPR